MKITLGCLCTPCFYVLKCNRTVGKAIYSGKTQEMTRLFIAAVITGAAVYLAATFVATTATAYFAAKCVTGFIFALGAIQIFCPCVCKSKEKKDTTEPPNQAEHLPESGGAYDSSVVGAISSDREDDEGQTGSPIDYRTVVASAPTPVVTHEIFVSQHWPPASASSAPKGNGSISGNDDSKVN